VSTTRPDRLPIGQLLVRHLRLFREQALARAPDTDGLGGFDLRPPHLHVFANIDAAGTRLTDLASRAGITRPSMLALVDELERHGLVERRPDPSDKRAKLIALTSPGRDVVRAGRTLIDAVEADYARRIGRKRFEEMCAALQDLHDDLNDPSRSA
jgi:DNA-binding MarR family transcriptional regulator